MRSRNLSATCIIRKRKALLGREFRYIIKSSITCTDKKILKIIVKVTHANQNTYFTITITSGMPLNMYIYIYSKVRERETERETGYIRKRKTQYDQHIKIYRKRAYPHKFKVLYFTIKSMAISRCVSIHYMVKGESRQLLYTPEINER